MDKDRPKYPCTERWVAEALFQWRSQHVFSQMKFCDLARLFDSSIADTVYCYKANHTTDIQQYVHKGISSLYLVKQNVYALMRCDLYYVTYILKSTHDY
jgi:hypothetical protein